MHNVSRPGVTHIVRSSLFGANEPQPISEGRAGRAARTAPDAERILGKRQRSVREVAQDHADLLR